MKRVRMFCILVGSVLAAFLVPLAARAWWASPRPVEAPAKAIVGWDNKSMVISQNVYSGSMQFYPALAVVSPTVCVAWSRQVADNVKYYDPYYRASPAGVWRGQVDIQPALSTKETTRVDVAVDNGEGLHFVWSEHTELPNTHTLYYSSTQISDPDPQLITQFDGTLIPAIAVSDSKVHVVWSEGTSSIEYASKNISSGSWNLTPITSSTSLVMHPDVEVDDAGTAHVVWSEGSNDSGADIFYANGNDWPTIRKVYDGTGIVDGRSPAIAVSGSNVYVVWTEWIDKENQYIRFRQSTDGGNNWDPSVPISGRFAAHDLAPTFLKPVIAVDSNGKIHVAFNGSGGLLYYEGIYYASKTQIGSWQCCRNLTWNVLGGNNTTPDIATSGEEVHLVWAGPAPFLDPEGYDPEVYYKHTVTLGEGVYLPIIMKSY